MTSACDARWRAPQIFAIELDQIEGAQDRSIAVARPVDQFKHRAVYAVPEIVPGRVVSSKQARCIYCRL